MLQLKLDVDFRPKNCSWQFGTHVAWWTDLPAKLTLQWRDCSSLALISSLDMWNYPAQHPHMFNRCLTANIADEESELVEQYAWLLCKIDRL